MQPDQLFSIGADSSPATSLYITYYFMEAPYDNFEFSKIVTEIFDYEIVSAVYDTPGSQLNGAKSGNFCIIMHLMFFFIVKYTSSLFF